MSNHFLSLKDFFKLYSDICIVYPFYNIGDQFEGIHEIII